MFKRKKEELQLGAEATVTIAPGLQKEFREKQQYNNKQRKLLRRNKK